MQSIQRRRTRLLAEIAVVVALAAMLGMVRLYRLPYGGSLSLKILPLLFLAVRRGPKAGMAGGGLTGIITLILDPVIFHPVQVVLDYLVPYLAIGLAGWFPAYPRTGIVLTGLARLASHVASGAIYFAAYAPPEINRQTHRLLMETVGWAPSALLQDWTLPWTYSILYNGSVVLPETLVMALVLPPLALRLDRYRR